MHHLPEQDTTRERELKNLAAARNQ